jgi:hypothetical protein
VVDATIVPIEELPPAEPFTSQVTAVLVEIVVPEDVVVALRFTVAVKSVWVLSGTVIVVGEMTTDVIVAVLLPLLPQDEMPKTTPAKRAMPKACRILERIKGSHPRNFPHKRSRARRVSRAGL